MRERINTVEYFKIFGFLSFYIKISHKFSVFDVYVGIIFKSNENWKKKRKTNKTKQQRTEKNRRRDKEQRNQIIKILLIVMFKLLLLLLTIQKNEFNGKKIKINNNNNNKSIKPFHSFVFLINKNSFLFNVKKKEML